MKKFLIIFGAFILMLITFATQFKLMHWPGAGPLFVMGIFLFSMFFLPIFFIDRMTKNPKGLNIVTNIFALFSTMMLFMGVLFKMMHWPGAGPMIVFGALLFIIPTLILYVIQQFKEYDRKFGEFWKTVVLGVLVSVFLIFWGLNVSRGILVSFLKVEDATLATNKNLAEYNATILDDIKAKTDSNSGYIQSAEKIARMSSEMVLFVENTKKELISIIEPDPGAQENHWNISSKDNYDIPTHYMCGNEPASRGRELYDRLVNFKKSLIKEMENLPLKNKEEVIGNLGDLGIKTELNPEMMENMENWQEGMFYQQTISGTLAILSGIQNEILNAEFKCLKTIKTN